MRKNGLSRNTSTRLFSVLIASLRELQDLSLWVKFPYTAIPVNSIGRVQGYYGETLVSIWRDGAIFFNDTTILSYMGYWDDKEPAEKMEARYIRNGAPRWISNFVAGGNANGTAMEDFLIHVYDCISNYSPSGADVSLFDSLAEVKTTSIWKSGSGKWQHIEPNHNWEILLLVRIEYQSIDVYLMCRNEFEKAKSDGSVTEQGKSGTSYEGWWFSPWERALPYATLVESITVDPDEKGYGDCNELRRALVECLES